MSCPSRLACLGSFLLYVYLPGCLERASISPPVEGPLTWTLMLYAFLLPVVCLARWMGKLDGEAGTPQPGR